MPDENIVPDESMVPDECKMPEESMVPHESMVPDKSMVPDRLVNSISFMLFFLNILFCDSMLSSLATSCGTTVVFPQPASRGPVMKHRAQGLDKQAGRPTRSQCVFLVK